MAHPPVEQLFHLATRHHQAGRLADAEKVYREILARQPNHAYSLHYLGVLSHQMGLTDRGVDFIQRSVALKPNWKAYDNLGNLYSESGRADEAIAAYRQAIRLNGNSAETNKNLGSALGITGQLDEAIAACRMAIQLKPDFAEAYSNLGNALKEKGQLDEAVSACRKAIALKPNFADAHNNLGNALREIGRVEEAIAACRQAGVLNPNLPAAQNNLGNALSDKGQFDDAISAYRRAIVINPNYADAHNNMGVALKEIGQLDAAIAAHRKAVALRPDFADAHFNLALALLQRGDFVEGWKENEWRWLRKDPSQVRLKYPQPQWDGSDLNDRTLFIHSEQGFGDIIQFGRYLPLVIGRGGKVIIGCPKPLRRLMQPMAGAAQWLQSGQAIPPFDVHCPMLSLPLVFGTTLETIPRLTSYLRPDERDAERWHKELASDPNRLKVGLAWAGRAIPRNRSIPPSTLAPLLRVSGVSFYSLQKSNADSPTTSAFRDLNLIDRTQDLNDFADTAALIANLDLVISIDSAVAHLAGAMGKPVWTMLKFVPDWRWLLDRNDTPWYPTMRLFRQPRIGDWDAVVEQITAAILSLETPHPEALKRL